MGREDERREKGEKVEIREGRKERRGRGVGREKEDERREKGEKLEMREGRKERK